MQILWTITFLFLLFIPPAAQGASITDIVFTTDYGDYGASYFNANGDKAVIFVPGAKFDRKGFRFLAEEMQTRRIASVSFDDIAGPAIIAAIDFLKNKGYSLIFLVGGSRGGGVVLTISDHPLISEASARSIKKLILLAPFGGDCPQRGGISMLFIIGEKDGLSFSNTDRLYAECKEPKKRIIIADTAYHAQQLFDTEHRERVAAAIIDFLTR
jgi:pimeloyl-ACP methyl ester carboxylesterase